MQQYMAGVNFSAVGKWFTSDFYETFEGPLMFIWVQLALVSLHQKMST